MKRILLALFVTAIFSLAISATDRSSTRGSEKAIFLCVKAVDPDKPVKFTGTYKFDTNESLIELDEQSTPFTIEMKSKSLTASFRELSGEANIYVEVTKLRGKKEEGRVTGKGSEVDVETYEIGDTNYMFVHSVEK